MRLFIRPISGSLSFPVEGCESSISVQELRDRTREDAVQQLSAFDEAGDNDEDADALRTMLSFVRDNAARGRLVFRGKILAQTQTLSELKVENDCVLHLTKEPRAAEARAPEPEAAQQPQPRAQPQRATRIVQVPLQMNGGNRLNLRVEVRRQPQPQEQQQPQPQPSQAQQAAPQRPCDHVRAAGIVARLLEDATRFPDERVLAQLRLFGQHEALRGWQHSLSSGCTALQRAILRDRAAIVDELLRDDAAAINATNERRETALHYACYHGRTEMVRKLLAVKNDDGVRVANVHMRTLKVSATPLEFAVRQGHADTVQAFLECAPDHRVCMAISNYGDTLIMQALKSASKAQRDVPLAMIEALVGACCCVPPGENDMSVRGCVVARNLDGDSLIDVAEALSFPAIAAYLREHTRGVSL